MPVLPVFHKLRAPAAPAAGYLRIFRLLWTIKHVEVVLEQCWSTINSMQRGLNTIKGQERVHGVAVDNAEQVSSLGAMVDCLLLSACSCRQTLPCTWAAGSAIAARLPCIPCRDGQFCD